MKVSYQFLHGNNSLLEDLDEAASVLSDRLVVYVQQVDCQQAGMPTRIVFDVITEVCNGMVTMMTWRRATMHLDGFAAGNSLAASVKKSVCECGDSPD